MKRTWISILAVLAMSMGCIAQLSPSDRAFSNASWGIKPTVQAVAGKPVNTIPFSSAFSIQEEKYNRENFVPEFGYYSVGSRNNYYEDWQIGWTGGMISTFPLLLNGSEVTRQNVIRNFD